jgi:hypothetical protein
LKYVLKEDNIEAENRLLAGVLENAEPMSEDPWKPPALRVGCVLGPSFTAIQRFQ